MKLYSKVPVAKATTRVCTTKRTFSFSFKRVALLAVALFICQAGYGQFFSIDFGGAVIFSGSKNMNFCDQRPKVVNGNMTTVGDTSYYYYKYSGSGAGIYVYPKFGMFQVANHAISIGVPIGFGFSGSANSQTGASESSFLIDISGTLDINGGKYNKKNDKDPFFGYYVGVGYGLTNTNGLGYELVRDGSVNASSPDLVTFNGRDEYAADKLSGKTTGLMLQAGIGSFSEIKFVNRLGLRVAHRFGSGNKLSYTTVCVFLHI